MVSQPTTSNFLKRRTELVNVAAHLFAKNGYNATGIAEICSVAGIGKGTLYHYISSKEDLLNLVHEDFMVPILESGHRVVALDLPPLERLRLLGKELLEIIADYPDHVWAFIHEWRALTGENLARFRSKRREYEAIVQRILEEGVAAGELQIPDVRVAVLGWLGMHNYTYQWFRTDGRLRSSDLASHFFEVFVLGLATPKTRARLAKKGVELSGQGIAG